MANQFNSLSVSLDINGGANIPVTVLFGNSVIADFSTGYYYDSNLNTGEVFILPDAALATGTVFDVTITGFDGGSALSTWTWQFSTL